MSYGSDVQYISVSQCFIATADCRSSIKATCCTSLLVCFSMCIPALPGFFNPQNAMVDTRIFAWLIAVIMNIKFIIVHVRGN